MELFFRIETNKFFIWLFSINSRLIAKQFILTNVSRKISGKPC